MNLREKQAFVGMVLHNNPDAVSEQLAAMELVESGVYYEPEELENIILRAAEYEMQARGGNVDAYWEVVAEAIDVEVNMNGYYAVELMNVLHHNGNRAMLLSGTPFDGFENFSFGIGLNSILVSILLILGIIVLIRKL